MNLFADNQQGLLTIDEAARLLSVTKKTLRRWEKRGLLQALRTPGNQRRYQEVQVFKLQNSLMPKRVIKPDSSTDIINRPEILERIPYRYVQAYRAFLIVFALAGASLIATLSAYDQNLAAENKSRITMRDATPMVTIFPPGGEGKIALEGKFATTPHLLALKNAQVSVWVADRPENTAVEISLDQAAVVGLTKQNQAAGLRKPPLDTTQPVSIIKYDHLGQPLPGALLNLE